MVTSGGGPLGAQVRMGVALASLLCGPQRVGRRGGAQGLGLGRTANLTPAGQSWWPPYRWRGDPWHPSLHRMSPRVQPPPAGGTLCLGEGQRTSVGPDSPEARRGARPLLTWALIVLVFSTGLMTVVANTRAAEVDSVPGTAVLTGGGGDPSEGRHDPPTSMGFEALSDSPLPAKEAPTQAGSTRLSLLPHPCPPLSLPFPV